MTTFERCEICHQLAKRTNKKGVTVCYYCTKGKEYRQNHHEKVKNAVLPSVLFDGDKVLEEPKQEVDQNVQP